MTLKNLSLFDLFLIQLVIYTAIFIWNDHIGFLLCITFASISLALLIISYLAELVERSKVPVWYYRLMWISVGSPLIVLTFFSLLGEFTFLSISIL